MTQQRVIGKLFPGDAEDYCQILDRKRAVLLLARHLSACNLPYDRCVPSLAECEKLERRFWERVRRIYNIDHNAGDLLVHLITGEIMENVK